jgi:glutamine---fructose-6-phosphate transaminase (isomerizing)
LARPECGITGSEGKDIHLPADLKVIRGAYLGDILDQPQALKNTLESLEKTNPLEDLAARLHRGRFQRIVLTGMGSSFHALHPLNLQLIDHGFTALMVETSELVHYKHQFFGPETLIVAVSQSGRSAEMIRLSEVNRKRSAVIAVTNTPESPLVKHSTAALFTQAGDEFSVSCKTYVTALMALKWLGDVLCGRDVKQTRSELSHAAPAVAAYLAHWQKYVRSLAASLSDIRHLFFVGRGSSLAAVGTGALIVKESDHFHAEGMSSAAFRHGPLEMLSREIFVLVFSGDPKTRALNMRLLSDIQQQGGRAAFAGEAAKLPCFRIADHGASIRAILEILPIQMITLALAARERREPGKFELATKVTTTE